MKMKQSLNFNWQFIANVKDEYLKQQEELIKIFDKYQVKVIKTSYCDGAKYQMFVRDPFIVIGDKLVLCNMKEDFRKQELKTLEKEYLNLLFQRYYNHLEQVPSFKSMKNKYIDDMKHSYFDVLDKTGLITLLNRMSENDLKEVLYNLDNDIFIKYAMVDGEQPKVKVLSLKDNNKNI